MNYSASMAGKITYQSAAAPSSYDGEVDALRCLAMTAVVLQHCQLLPFGWTGVWLFFVISGFAITSPLLGSGRLKHSKPGLIRNFYLRRCLRIWPVYFLVVACNIVAATSLGKGEVTSALPWLATFTYNYRMILDGETWPANGHLWTISVEEQFLAGEGWLCSLCRLPFLQQIGLLSYGSYVYHAPVLMLPHALFGSPGTPSLAFSLGKLAFAYPLTLLIAFLSYRYFEAPILKLRTRFA